MLEKDDIEITTHMDVGHMYDFLLHHVYYSFTGMISILITVFAAGSAIYVLVNDIKGVNVVVLLAVVLMLAVVQPMMLYRKAKQQVKGNPDFKRPLMYRFSNENLIISQGENQNEVNWNQITKVVSTKQSILVYLSKRRAFILPKSDIEDIKALKNLICKQFPSAKIR